MTLTWFEGPGITHRPLPKSRGLMGTIRRMNCHIAVSEADSLYHSFDDPGEPDSHVYVLRGTAAQIADPNGMANMEQYVPLTHKANADYEGNDATFSVETEGGRDDDGDGIPNEPADILGEWDPAQVRRLRWLWTKVRKAYNLPNKLVETARWNSEENRGLGWHRIGIDGNFPAGELGGRLQRGATSTTDPRFMHWSSKFGKGCPGPNRIRQMPSILAPFPVPVTAPPIVLPELEIEDEDMKMLVRQSNGATFLAWGGKAIAISSGQDLEAIRNAEHDSGGNVISEEVHLAEVTAEFWSDFATALGGVQGM